MSEIGITSIAAYLPRLRLARKAIADANKWANPALVSQGKGHRTSCTPDEDSLTMAVEASRTCLSGAKGFEATTVHFASTTSPFKDRANSVLLSEAVAMPSDIRCADFSGFLGAGVTALIDALCNDRPTLIAAADKRAAKPGSPLEMALGHGAAAVTTGSENIIARLIADHTTVEDFVDHYRSSGADFDYIQEERWVRDEGQVKIALPAISKLLAKAGYDGCDVHRFAIAGVKPAIARQIATACGIPEDRLTDTLDSDCGNIGTAHALLLLSHAIEQAGPNERILLVNVAQGAQCILFETTDAITQWTPPKPISAQLENGSVDHNYNRFLSFNDQLDMDWGVRAERDNRTSLSAFNRHRKTVTSFIGGECTECGTRQFPKGQACVNPECRSFDTLVEHPFQNKTGKVKSFTEDWLAISANPPLMYGNVAFEDGGVIMMEFTDFEPGELKVGQPVRFVFRIKDKDPKRNFCRYFWKAAPTNIVKA
ncbi:3-oxoacyl-[acyl-carrier-protein] synthase III C-terminal domain-containing protein [Emcibacter sp.]|uniref:3-oxoacyl-[acyl-carrier-protein] synthase III C-terminal domain-containing protein n=1 Tax=Emcibacter sp. TaxID=1979954 RepID=UPI002AA646B9|nr:3-oxoacyl-[acyl-carrier-protein] synthase III C-terminal domain-containing protein [Emcibacter sp.]